MVCSGSISVPRPLLVNIAIQARSDCTVDVPWLSDFFFGTFSDKYRSCPVFGHVLILRQNLPIPSKTIQLRYLSDLFFCQKKIGKLRYLSEKSDSLGTTPVICVVKRSFNEQATSESTKQSHISTTQ